MGRFDFAVRGARFVDAALGRTTQAWSRFTGHTYMADSSEARHVFDPQVLEARPPCVLWGTLQSERYFSDRASEVDGALQLPPLADVLPRELARPVVGVSFRRGDFNSIGWALPVDYYEAALASLCERVRPGTLIAFADDRAFCELVEPWLERFGAVAGGFRLSDDPAVNLAMLAACDHNVIANSSFSWWGAWLGEHRGPRSAERAVLAPADWRRGRPTPDVIPDRWTAVSW